MRIDVGIADDGVQPCILEHFDILRLLLLIRNIVDGLRLFAVLGILFGDLLAEHGGKRHILALQVLVDDDVLDLIVETVVLDAAELDEGRKVAPAVLVLFFIVAVEFLEFIGHLLGDVLGDLLHLCIVLQEGTRNVERDIGAVDDAVQKHQELGNDFLDVIGNEHLIAVQLDLPALELHLLSHLREVEDAL